MDEQPNSGIGETVTYHLGRKEKVVVVYPNQIARLVQFLDRLGEEFICLNIWGVVLVRGGIFSRDILPEKVMKERPQSCRRIQQSKSVNKIQHSLCLQYPS